MYARIVCRAVSCGGGRSVRAACSGARSSAAGNSRLSPLHSDEVVKTLGQGTFGKVVACKDK